MLDFQQLLNQFTRVGPALQEYGNAVRSPFTGSLKEQPLGSSGFYGQNQDGSNRSMAEAMEYVVSEQKRREDLIREMLGR